MYASSPLKPKLAVLQCPTVKALAHKPLPHAPRALFSRVIASSERYPASLHPCRGDPAHLSCAYMAAPEPVRCIAHAGVAAAEIAACLRAHAHVHAAWRLHAPAVKHSGSEDSCEPPPAQNTGHI